MALGAASGKHSKPIKTKPESTYKLRPAVPKVAKPAGKPSVILKLLRRG